MGLIDFLNRTGKVAGLDADTLTKLRAYDQQGGQRRAEARERPAILRASGLKIEKMSSEKLRAVAAHKQPWQALAWGYRDLVPELRYMLEYRARAISKITFYIAEISEDEGDEPIPVSLRNDKDPDKRSRVTLDEALCRAAEDELSRLPLDAGYSFLGVWSVNFDVAGECWLHGRTDPETGAEEWRIRSVLEVDVQGAAVTIKDSTGQPRTVNFDTEELYRLWVPHPALAHLGDSALNSLADVLEDIVLAGREQRAVSRSRIMTNGLLLMPETMATANNVREDDDTEESRLDRFMNDLEATLLAPITNEGDAGGVVPAVLFGTRDDIDAVKHLTFERSADPSTATRLDNGLRRMTTSLDAPPEALTGMGDANHWSAWLIDGSTFRYHLEPGIRMMVDSVTEGFIRRALASQFPADQLRRVRVWYDAGKITENPNRRDDALAALDRILIGPKAGREALGFGDGDAPTPEEALQLIAAKNGIDQSTAAAILAWAAAQEGVDMPAPPEQLPSADRPQLGPAQPAEPEPTSPGTPQTAPAGITAAGALAHALMPATGDTMAGIMGMPAGEWQAWLDRQGEQLSVHDAFTRALEQARNTPLAAVTAANSQPTPSSSKTGSNRYRLAVDDSRALMEIERALRDQLLAACDAEVNQALQRAGSRLRSKATANQELHAQLRSLPVTAWAAKIGPEQCLALNADVRYLLAGAWESLSEKFSKWTWAAIDRVVARLQRMLGLDPQSTAGRAAAARLRGQMGARIDTAWAGLRDDLDGHVERLMFDRRGDTTEHGEQPEFETPAVFIRDALAEIGGTPPTSGGINRDTRRTPGHDPVTGMVNGMAVTGEFLDADAVHVGYEWQYGYEPRATFEPHLALDRVRFLLWDDDALAVDEQGQWLKISHYHPGDHGGCLCSFTSVWGLPTEPIPDATGIVAARLALPPSADMQNLLTLAERDDAAGRTGTTAQEMRDQYLAVRGLRDEFLEAR